jgi:tetratricopeptide (TPR) repeat protein
MAETSSRPLQPFARSNALRLAVVVFGLLACVWGVWTSGREGLSQLFAGYSLLTDQLEKADEAVRLSPTLPEAHYVRATLLYNRDEMTEAIGEYELAVALRPRDYALWLELGRARDEANDPDGAIAAFRESVRLAPFYSQPSWQLGNALYRAGRRDEAFVALRRAVSSDPKLMSQALDLSWPAFGGDTQAIEQALPPQTVSMHAAMARFFVKHGKIGEAVQQFRATGNLSDDERRNLIKDLLAANHFVEAREVWSGGRKVNSTNRAYGLAEIIDGGFEEEINTDEPGFGWQVASNQQGLRVSLDMTGPHGGARSLRVDWNGNSDPATPVVSQLVVVEPKTRYRLRFAARAQELLTIALPLVTVVDPGDDKKNILKQSSPIPKGASGWQDYSVEFTTTETTSAVLIEIRRENCATPPCPVFGHVWFDDFVLEKLQ